MSFDGNGMGPADVAALMRNTNGWGGDGFGGGWWIILFFLLCLGGGWGNGYGNANAAPYAIQADVQRGFDQSATTNQISQLQNQVGQGFADAAVANCAGNANITQAITNAQYATTQAIGGAKDTLTLGLNQLAMANQQGFYDNKAGQADLKYTIATENCADRQAISDGLRDLMAQNTANTNAIIASNTAGFQGIQDKLCQLEIDGLKSENQNLRTQLNMANLAASQTAQTAQLIQDNNLQTQALINRIAPAPVPAYTVANPNCCYNTGCGCGV